MQENLRTAAVLNLKPEILPQLTAIVHDYSPCIPYFFSLSSSATPVTSSYKYQMVIHANNMPSREPFFRFDGPQSAKIAAVVPGAKDGILGIHDIVLPWRCLFNTNGNEVFNTIPFTHCAYNPLFFALFLPHGTEGWHLCSRCQLLPARQSEGKQMSPLMFNDYQLFQIKG